MQMLISSFPFYTFLLSNFIFILFFLSKSTGWIKRMQCTRSAALSKIRHHQNVSFMQKMMHETLYVQALRNSDDFISTYGPGTSQREVTIDYSVKKNSISCSHKVVFLFFLNKIESPEKTLFPKTALIYITEGQDQLS